jgi:ATP-dependent Clp protease ATP-binding subunit ClpA
MFDRLDQAAHDVMHAAFQHAVALNDTSVATEHVLLALATTDATTSRLLAGAGSDPEQLRQVLSSRVDRRGRPRNHDTLLATLGIDAAAVRQRAEHSFGAEAITRATTRVRPARSRRGLWSRISCSKPLGPRRCDSPLGGRQLGIIPRVKRVLDRATRDAAPGLATPAHLLLTLVTANEPAGEVLAAQGVDLKSLAAQIRNAIAAHQHDQRAE